MKASDIARELAMDKGWRNCFLAGEKLCTYYLLRNFSQFESFKEISKALVRNLEKIFGSNSANPSWIIIFDKAINLFTPGTLDLENLNLDTNCYVASNHILNCLKKNFIWFFILSIESKVEKLLLPDI